MDKLKKYAVFWEPENDVKEFIIKWKNLISIKNKNAIYLNHPPHLTFFILYERNTDQLISKFLTLKEKLKTKEVKFIGAHIFENDFATNADTISLRLSLNNELIEMQKTIAETIYNQKKINNPMINFSNKKMIQSYLKWGFPFIGNHWIPHLTIASVKSELNEKIIADFKNSVYPDTTLLNNISLVEVNGDIHKVISKINLNEN